MSLLAACLLALPQAEALRMEVSFAGAPAGESRYERRRDGTFKSVTTFALGPSKIHTTLEGQILNGRIVRYRAFGTQAGTEIALDYVPRKLGYLLKGKREEVEYTIPAAFASSLHPQLAADLLKGIEPGKERKSSVYLLDVGAEVPAAVQALPDATLRVGGQDERVRRFGLTISPTEIGYSLNAKGAVVAMDVPGQRLRFVAKGWEGLFADASHPELSQPTYPTERLKGLRMRTRDNVLLVADAVRPAGRGRFPAILERTPYGRETSLALADYWASRGYVYVAQDCRGRGDSDGAWDPFVREGKDGYDAIAWVARQPWCDGNVGTIGGSYAGTVQWQAAIERPPALRCIVPQVATSDAMHNLPYENGTFFLYGSLWWSSIVKDKKADLTAAQSGLPFSFGLLGVPVGAVDTAVFGAPNPIFQAWIRRPTLNDWKGYDHLARLPESQVPALHVSGWFDGDGIGTKLDWEAMRRAGREDQWLVYGPWTHAFNTTTRLGDVDFGPDARYDLDGLTLRFFDTYLKRKDVGMEAVPRVQAFVTGANRWVSLDGWPSSASTFQTLYLAPDALAPSPGGAGTAVWNYDPAKDLDSIVRNEQGSPYRLPKKGTYVLFKGEPTAKPVAVAGPFEVRLFFKSSAVDTDLFASLLDVAPDGKMRPIGQPGKLRASYRESLARPTLLKPGRTYTALLQPWDAAHELAKGHRLALLVDSSLFPLFARNLGTGEPLATGKRSVPQRNVILTGTMTPSRITFRKLW